MRPSTPNCMGYVKIQFLRKKIRKKTITFRFLFAIFSTTNDRRIMKREQDVSAKMFRQKKFETFWQIFFAETSAAMFLPKRLLPKRPEFN